MRDRQSLWNELGVGVLALSVDEPERSRALREELALPFPLLSDSDRVVIEQWSLYNRGEKGGIAYPAMFALDRAQQVTFRSLDRTAARVDLDALVTSLRNERNANAGEPAQVPISLSPRDLFGAVRAMLRFGIKTPKRERT